MTRRLGVVTALAIAITTTASVPAPAAFAASDPLAAAQAKITEAQVAADKAAADYDAAQTRYYQLQDDAGRTAREVTSLHGKVTRLASIARQRAVAMYEGGVPSPLDFLGSASDALDAGRRVVLVEHANATSIAAIQQLGAATDDLRVRQRSLQRELAQQTKALKNLKARQADVQRSLEDATRAEHELRVRLERERRAAEYATLVRQAQAAAHARAVREAAASAARTRENQLPAPSGRDAQAGGGSGRILGSGSWVCPVQGAVSFTDTYGAPRSGGRTHKGVDMFAARGTPTVAVVAGSVFFQSDPLGGLSAYVNGTDGNTYYYAHLNDYVGGGRTVAAGEVIGHVGNTGDASDAPPHLHFEIRPGGPNGERINPYPTVRAHC